MADDWVYQPSTRFRHAILMAINLKIGKYSMNIPTEIWAWYRGTVAPLFRVLKISRQEYVDPRQAGQCERLDHAG
jgi:hypothetical protein